VEAEDVDILSTGWIGHLRERHWIAHESLALAGALPPCVIDEDSPHHLRGDPEECARFSQRTPRCGMRRRYASLTTAVGCSVWPARSRRR
jgi:hypothetical protein